MVVGFVGSGNMAAAMARGWAGEFDRMLFTDSGSGRAKRLAEELGGEAVKSNAELAERADLLVLAVKPAHLEAVAPDLSSARVIVSMLGATSLEQLNAAFPRVDVIRLMPNVGVEVRRGVLCVAGAEAGWVREKLGVLGLLVELPDADFDAATAIMGCSPAYLAAAAEALVEAGAEAGLEEALAAALVAATMDGTAALLEKRSGAEIREAVMSPGGSTEAGLEVLEREGAREAFRAAVRASLERMRR
ncbi:MAG TPA: pyrroline-5-carboxylate reductase [Solirubrobacterales bacterium]|nr:pyrroline-5-carboxylate reductase [Solirubrobacterales bacterium]